jgi:hypothetical protein
MAKTDAPTSWEDQNIRSLHIMTYQPQRPVHWYISGVDTTVYAINFHATVVCVAMPQVRPGRQPKKAAHVGPRTARRSITRTRAPRTTPLGEETYIKATCKMLFIPTTKHITVINDAPPSRLAFEVTGCLDE